MLISILVSFLCSVLEAVLLSIDSAFVERQLKENPSIGATLTDFQQNIDKPLAAILTLNTIAHTVGAIGVGTQAVVIWGDSIIATLIIPVVMTLAILILSEIIPKTLGANYWQELSRFTVQTLKIILVILAPLVTVTQLITRTLKRDKSKSVLSRADFITMTELGQRQGVFDERESGFLQNFIKFRTVSARDIMTPQSVIIAAPETQLLSEFHAKHPDLRFSRIPIYADNLDNFTGYILRDDLLAALLSNGVDQPLKSLQRDLTAVELTYPLLDLFSHYTEARTHLSLVLDEFGGVVGLVTMEDVIETLLGIEIVDERDGVVDMQALARKQWEQRARRIGLLAPDEDAESVVRAADESAKNNG